MPGIVFILGVYTPVRGLGNLVPALIKKKKKNVQRWGVWAVWGRAARQRAAGLSLHVRNWRSKGHLAPLMRPTKFPEIPVSLERNTEVFRHPLL